ncbi:MAG: endolytic transglycosylase MltG [Candidatus Ryanbacteria bacterium]|nr:endolytic transglycosylase MltG [Candidatus Ryanbacteria bacterium]
MQINKFTIATIVGLVLAVVVAWLYLGSFGAPQKADGDITYEQFTIAEDAGTGDVVGRLSSEGFIKSPRAFRLALWWNGTATIKPGGYMIAKTLDAWTLADIFSKGPALIWVSLPEGYRKEQMANVLARKLGWTDEQEIDWVVKHTAPTPDEIEGVYFGDTYLMPKDDTPAEVALRLRARFNEKFAPLAKEAVAQNIRWPTLLKIASLVQREAGGKDDMPIIAGIMWNRLLAKNPMKLDIDATLQYARDTRDHYAGSSYDPDGGWWGAAKAEDKKIDSPFNTYTNKGLPPHPIANPSLDAINAVLFPAKTDCLFYLHSPDKQIHCAKTYEEHKKNIDTYLR